ncbi:GTP cyclohydrolase I, putative [Plasmodium gallinaceum]|uniref:GTP cyclohydrolase 1 n=1 Tax=Plasmodium gallinaceum TaxID=5849 RepID=A0A1J1GM80_PLAGA|nr:GTP cyclohydrolase I, putative [Plasmodium gallinaceum]CRG93544.1 GTP cyclohydrolase I, putative [Plasmodium gallinaceum]
MMKNLHLNRSNEIYSESSNENEKSNSNYLLNTKKVKKKSKREFEKNSHNLNDTIMNNGLKKCEKKAFNVIEKGKKRFKRLAVKKKCNSNVKLQDNANFISNKICILNNENKNGHITSNNNLNDVKIIKNKYCSKKTKIDKMENDTSSKKNEINVKNNDNNNKVSDKNYEKNTLKKIKNKKISDNHTNSSKIENQVFDISHHIYNILNILNLPKSDILKRTNKRFAETFLYLTNGYNVDIEKIFKGSMYKRKYKNNSVIKITGIQINSLCKHHLLPFQGICTIEYVPNKYIMGLSKFSRIVDAFSRRLQLQEDLTNDICNILRKYLKPLNLQVTIVAKHLCINMRGVKEHNSTTVTQVCCKLKNNKYTSKSYINNCFKKENDISNYDSINKMNYDENY